MSSQLTVHLTPEYSHLDSKTHQILSLVTIKAPPAKQETNTRAPLDLIAVLDVSGSMEGDKIRMVRDTICFAIKQLQATDRLCIVLFATNVSVLFRLSHMTGDAKQKATELVENIKTRDSTNLSGGLEKAYDILIEDSKSPSNESETREKTVRSILLFTDGEANVGLTKISDIVQMMKAKQETLKKPCTVFSFGYGKDHSVDLLRCISDAGSAIYYFVEDEEKIATAFGDCLGGLLSVAAQNIELKMEMKEGVLLKKVFGTTQKKSGASEVNATKHSMELGDIYHEEERNILVLIEVPSLSSTELSKVPFEQPLMDVVLRGFDVLLVDQFEVKQNLTLIRDNQTKQDTEKSQRIGIQRQRLLTVEAVDEARKLATDNHFDKARQVLNTAIQTLKNSPTGNSNITQQLVADLQECLDDMRNREEFNEVGSKKMAMCSRSHQTERAIHSKAMYSNASKSSAKQNFSSNVKK